MGNGSHNVDTPEICFGHLWLKAAGGEIHVRVNQDRASVNSLPLVCVHGLVISGRYMMPFAKIMAATAEIYVPDLPGYGRSYVPKKIFSASELADALAAILDALSLPRANFLGNSYGCQVLAEFAARYPQRVGKLVMVGPTVNSARRTFPAQLVDLLKSGLHEKLSLAGLLAYDYLKAGPRVVIETVKHALKHPVEKVLPRIPAPVLVARGAHDAMARQAWCEEVVRLLPHAKLQVLAGGAHALNYSCPQALTDLVKGFLADALPENATIQSG